MSMKTVFETATMIQQKHKLFESMAKAVCLTVEEARWFTLDVTQGEASDVRGWLPPTLYQELKCPLHDAKQRGTYGQFTGTMPSLQGFQGHHAVLAERLLQRHCVAQVFWWYENYAPRFTQELLLYKYQKDDIKRFLLHGKRRVLTQLCQNAWIAMRLWRESVSLRAIVDNLPEDTLDMAAPSSCSSQSVSTADEVRSFLDPEYPDPSPSRKVRRLGAEE